MPGNPYVFIVSLEPLVNETASRILDCLEGIVSDIVVFVDKLLGEFCSHQLIFGCEESSDDIVEESAGKCRALLLVHVLSFCLQERHCKKQSLQCLSLAVEQRKKNFLIVRKPLSQPCHNCRFLV